MAADGLPRVELFKGEKLIDTIPVHRFSLSGMHNLFEKELGQKRDRKRTWETVAAEQELAAAFSGRKTEF